MQNKLRVAYIILNVLMLWFALGLQFYISTDAYMATGRSFAGAIIQIISFYTIQTNLLIAVGLTAILFAPESAWGRFFSRTSVLTSIAVYITIVGLIYATVLKGLLQLDGLFMLADFLLHTLSPIVFVVFWLLFVPKESIKWNQVLLWAIFPLLYLVYSLIRGAISGDYPYPFVNAAKLGYGQVAVNSVGVLVVFLVLSGVFIGISRVLRKG
jgi:hypothetical protein